MRVQIAADARAGQDAHAFARSLEVAPHLALDLDALAEAAERSRATSPSTRTRSPPRKASRATRPPGATRTRSPAR